MKRLHQLLSTFALALSLVAGQSVAGTPQTITFPAIPDQISSALATTALNPSGVFPLALSFSEPPTAAELIQLQDKHNELLTSLKRP